MSHLITPRNAVIAGLSAIVMTLAGCSDTGPSPATRGGLVGPALDVLALDFERTNFTNQSRVSGSVAQAQRKILVSTATSGRMRQEATGPIPTEVRVEITELSTRGNIVTMKGKLGLRDLALGATMAELPNFSASGPMPIAAPGSSMSGLVFRGVEEEILTWLRGLECDTTTRSCGKPRPKPVPAVDDTEAAPLTEDGDLQLAALVGPRPQGSLTKLNAGGIRPDAVIAAAAPAEAASASGGLTTIGTTVAALGLLDRSGFWLQTPLVTTEGPGVVVSRATGKRLNVTLVPKDGPAGGGSQISLAAMNELGAQMTDLITLDVLR